MARALAREAAVTRPGCGPPPRAGRRRAAQSAPDLRALGDGWAADVAVLEPEAQAGLISLRVRAALREVVGDDAAAADADAALATVGVSSLHAVALAAKLAQESDLALSPTLLFECVSIRGIAQHILGLLVEAPPEADHDAAAQRAPGALSVRSGADEARLVIGVLGAACRLPGGVNSPRELWVLLESAAHAVRPPPAGRPSNGRPSGYLDASVLAGFDGAAFHVGAAEACAMDPQQRLCLQCAAEALEASCLFDGGALRAVRGKAVATYVGVTQVDYAAYAGSPSAFTATAVGTTAAVANRVAYALDLRGASVAIDTACSSALVALDAARSRLLQRADVAALVGGVNVQLVKRWSDAFARAGMLSPTHRCAFGDDEADGYVRGEGCAFVTLVAASSAEAVADLRGGIILASTAVNQDGRSNGLTAPNPAAQARMLRAALERAAAPPAHAGGAHAPPGYVEAHGTGTRLGDPIELAALSRVLGGETPLRCASVKSNLGHLECGAGAAALVKVACCLHRERLPPSLHVRVPNRVVDWATCGVVVVTANAAARPQDKRCGASGFGFAGTNAHALLDGRRPR
ncbi:thiolase-like protein, partial [Pelagophyceae sp. CCMP2097]